jgi:hypothetical protein
METGQIHIIEGVIVLYLIVSIIIPFFFRVCGRRAYQKFRMKVCKGNFSWFKALITKPGRDIIRKYCNVECIIIPDPDHLNGRLSILPEDRRYYLLPNDANEHLLLLPAAPPQRLLVASTVTFDQVPSDYVLDTDTLMTRVALDSESLKAASDPQVIE